MISNKIFDYQKFHITIIQNVLLSHIRYTKKEIEREIKNIFISIKKDSVEIKDKEEFKKRGNELLIKIQELKIKLKNLHEEELKIINELKTRFNQAYDCLKIKENLDYNSVKKYSDFQNKYLLYYYFIENNLYETSKAYQKENKIVLFENNIFKEKEILTKYIKEENISKVLEWVNFYKKQIIRNNNDIIIPLLSNIFYYFKTKQENTENLEISCIKFIRKYMGDLMSTNKQDISKLVMSVLTKKEDEKADYLKNVLSIISNDYQKSFGFGNYSLLEILIILGISTLKNNNCKQNNDSNCPICNLYDIAIKNSKTFSYMQNRSYLFCSLDNHEINSSNSSFVNKDGNVVCKQCMEKYKIDEDKFEQPITKKEFKISECKPLYLS